MTKALGKRLDLLRSRKLNEAMSVLKALGFGPRQHNEVAAYTLLAMLDLKPSQSWSEAANPLRGITPIIGFLGEFYNVKYAPNTSRLLKCGACRPGRSYFQTRLATKARDRSLITAISVS